MLGAGGSTGRMTLLILSASTSLSASCKSLPPRHSRMPPPLRRSIGRRQNVYGARVVRGDSRGTASHPSQSCNVATIEDTVRQCHYVPRNGARSLHVVLVDEADQMSSAAQLSLLSKLDGTAFPPSTVFIFTANDTERLQDPFLSRCMTLPFSSQGIAKPTAELLERIWLVETGTDAGKPNFLRMVQDCKNNVRDAVNSLQVLALDRSALSTN
jgi:DNA polymerase III delta prime subunit